MNEALILAGCNLEPRKENLERAALLLANGKVKIDQTSSIYISPAWGYDSGNDYYNVAYVVKTEYSAEELMKHLLTIEDQMGRRRTQSGAYEDRNIDLDILLYNNETIDTDFLKVPHPRLQERRFALVPASEIAAEWVHPVIQRPIKDLLKDCTDRTTVIKAQD